jgi:hypothetical protein
LQELDCDLFSGEPWQPCEIDYLKSIYGRAPTVEIALDLKRSIGAVCAKAHALGLTTNRASRRAEGSAVVRRAWGLALRRYFRGRP